MGNTTTKPTQPKKTTLFKRDGCVYRIPSLIYITEETMFLAFAEKRKTESDVDAMYLVMRKGIYKTGDVFWTNTESLENLCLEGHRMMNPCPVYEEATKTVFLFYNCIPIGVTEKNMRKWGNQSKLLYSKSTDCGETWSDPTDITDVTNGIRNLAMIFVSPGHGIQTESGKLVVPAYVYVAKYWCIHWWFTKAHAFYVYSEDKGDRWRISERIEKYECGECELAEIVSDHGEKMLYCNARSTSKKRVEALTLTIGGNYKIVKECCNLEEKGGCFGSVVSLPGLEELEQKHRDWLLFSHPAKKDRRDLGIYLNKSPQKSEAWSKPWIIHDGPSAYSDLAYCKDANTFAILFESGAERPYDEIDFCLFTVEDVLENINKNENWFSMMRRWRY